MATALARQPDEDVFGEETAEDRVYRAARPIIDRLSGLASEQVRAKKPIEQRWLDELRHYHGKYDEVKIKELDDADRSTAFVNITRPKTNSWAARLSDLLFPTDGRNWDTEPTPIPKLIEGAKQAVGQAEAMVKEANRTADAADAAADPAQQQALHRQASAAAEQAQSYAAAAKRTDAEVAEARKRAKRMRDAIDDQLTESNYAANCRDIIEDGCRIGTGIIKGPLTANRLRQEWRSTPAPGGSEAWGLAQVSDPTPEYRRVDPFHFFPDMSAATIADSEFTFERSLPTKKDLKRFARKLGFNKAGVRRLLKEGPSRAPDGDLDYLATLRTITGEGDPLTNRYVMWEYHGPLECDDICTLLRAMGDYDLAEAYRENRDPLDELRVIIHFCHGEVLKIAEEYPLDSGAPLYSVWNFEKSETGIFGYGIPHILWDSQNATSSAWRMMMDNAGLAIGPQIVVDKGAIRPQDGNWDLKPLKRWEKSSAAYADPRSKPFETFDIPINQSAIAGIIQMAKTFADEETSMPLLAQGEQGSASATLGGMSMLFNSANVVFRRVVKAFDDDLTAPTITRAFEWNMQFNSDETIKGDMKIKALGTSVLLVREIQSQNMMFILTNWTGHPVLGAYIKAHGGLVKAFDTMMIPQNDVLYSEEEAQENLARAAAAAQQGPQQMDPAQLRLETAQIERDWRVTIAQMEQQSRLAEIASREKISIEDVRAKYGIAQLRVDSSERSKAADIAIEQRRGDEAVAAGRDPAPVLGAGLG